MGVEAACSGIKFGQDSLEAILASGRKVMVGWRLLWMAVVWAVMTSMEGSHGRRPWEVNESTKCYVLHLLLNFEGKHLQKKRKKRRRRKLREGTLLFLIYS